MAKKHRTYRIDADLDSWIEDEAAAKAKRRSDVLNELLRIGINAVKVERHNLEEVS